MRRLTLIFISLLLAPGIVGAQSFVPSTGGTGNTSFQGMSFTGVGGAILNCTNIGSSISGFASNLFSGNNNTNTPIGQLAQYAVPGAKQEVPVNDKDLKKQAEKQAKKENCLDGIAYAIAKNALQKVSDKTLNWVNTGFNGNPLYVRDIDSYLKSIKDQKLESFLSQVPNSNPIFGNAIRSTITNQVTGYTDGRIQQVMNTPEARAYQDFQSDFTKGGWSAFLNSNNNSISAYFDSVQQVSQSIDTAQQNVKDELVQGDGFLSMKKCAEWSGTGATTGTGGIGDLPPTTSGAGGTAEQAPSANSAVGGRTCLRYETVTPGAVIAQQTAYVTNSAVRQLEQADKINEVLGSFFDQLLNRLFSNGLGNLGGRGGAGVSTGAGSNVVFGTNGLPLASIAGSGAQLGYQSSTGGFNNDFDISRPQQLRSIIQTQKDYVSRATDSQVAMERIVPILGALDYCLPGPNPTWGNGLSDNFQSLLGSLSQPPANGPSALQGFLNSIPILGGLFGGGNNPPPILAGEPILYDKVTDTQRKITPQTFFSPSLAFGGRTVSYIPPYLESSFNELVNEYSAAGFDVESLSAAYANIVSGTFEQADARAFAKNAYKESGKLVGYNQSIIGYNTQYNQNISDTEDAIEQLTAIYTRTQTIVAGAKARYIAAQAAAGTPVSTSCINQAYAINNNPIVPVARVESDAPNAFVLQSITSSNYFYNNL